MPQAVTNKQQNYLRKISQGPVPWLIPIMVVLLSLFVYPTFEVIRYSFTDASILTTDFNYTLKSYRIILGNENTYTTLKVTIIFVFFSVIFQALIGLIVALVVDKGESMNLRGTVFVRVATLLSWAIPGSIIGVIWKMLYSESATGILISFLGSIGVTGVSFLTSATNALICVIVANIWRGSAQSMILTYSGLKTISGDIVEAANIDGASSFQRLWFITLPSIIPVISINIVLNTIMTFNTFDMVMSLTGGGPGRATEVLAMTSYNAIFTGHNLGRGSAYATLLLLINASMGAVYFYFLKKRGDVVG